MESVYNFNGSDIIIQKDGDEIWFRGKDVAEALGYKRPGKAVQDHVSEDDRKKVTKYLTPQNGRSGQYLTSQNGTSGQRRKIHLINEPGVYSLVFSSKLPIAMEFKKWVFRDVLPSIRKTGKYIAPRPIGNQLLLTDEADLHHHVISYIRRYYPDAIIIPGLGENQDTSYKRVSSWKKGYIGGQPDIIIGNLHKKYTGLAIELKTPKGWGTTSERQESYMNNLSKNGYRTLVSCDYDEVHRCIDEHMSEVRVMCEYCGRKFRNEGTIRNHYKYFHRISHT